MDQELKKIKKITKFMKKQGVLSLKASGFEIQLSPAAFELDAELEEKIDQELTPDPAIPELSPYTPEQIMLWSSPGNHFQEGNSHVD